mmetsp:Transcript_37515/g.27666  ORF Transcript_37515/g.27666 Transcript_37515/m.27666 type:complete len:96 (-) Transcript_37515:1877-2164(-)
MEGASGTGRPSFSEDRRSPEEEAEGIAAAPAKGPIPLFQEGMELQGTPSCTSQQLVPLGIAEEVSSREEGSSPWESAEEPSMEAFAHTAEEFSLT